MKKKRGLEEKRKENCIDFGNKKKKKTTVNEL